jgi:hypothetical protein
MVALAPEGSLGGARRSQLLAVRTLPQKDPAEVICRPKSESSSKLQERHLRSGRLAVCERFRRDYDRISAAVADASDPPIVSEPALLGFWNLM